MNRVDEPVGGGHARARLHPVSRRALREAWPLLVPAIPFALVLGLEMTRSAMPVGIAWTTNVAIFAGAAQLATVTLAATATFATLVATAAVINLRHLMYSGALAPRFRRQPRWFRWVAPYFLIDQVFALANPRTELDDDDWRRYYLTVALFFIVPWCALTTVGLFVGSTIPASWRLGVAPAVMFAGLVVIGLTNRPGAIAAITGAGVCFAALGVPNNGGILIGAVAGVLAGSLADRAASGRAERDAAGTADPGGDREEPAS